MVIDGRIIIAGRDCNEPVEILLDSIQAEPHRAEELQEQAAERVFFYINGPEAWSARYLRRPAQA